MRDRIVVGLMALILLGAGTFLFASLSSDAGDDRLDVAAYAASDEGAESRFVSELDPGALDAPAELRTTQRRTKVKPELGHHVTLRIVDHRGERVPDLPIYLRLADDAEGLQRTRTRRSDIDGRVTFRKLPELSSYFVATDSDSHYIRGSLRVIAMPEEHEIELHTAPYAHLVGEIRSEAGEPCAGIIVGMIGAENVRTDDQGRFRMSKVRGSSAARKLVALSRQADFAASTEVPVIDPGSHHEGYLMLLTPSGRLEGRVYDYRDAALADVAVEVPINRKKYAEPWQPVLAEAAEYGAFTLEGDKLKVTSSSEGSYGINLPWATNYRALARKEKWFCRGGWNRVEALGHGEVRRVDFIMNQGGALAGPLIWPGDVPTEGQVVVTARRLGRKKGLTRTNRIDPGESWYIDGLPAGDYALRVTYEEAVRGTSLNPTFANFTNFESIRFGNPPSGTMNPGGKQGPGGGSIELLGDSINWAQVRLNVNEGRGQAQNGAASRELRSRIEAVETLRAQKLALEKVLRATEEQAGRGTVVSGLTIAPLEAGNHRPSPDFNRSFNFSNELSSRFLVNEPPQGKTLYIGELRDLTVRLDASRDDLALSLQDVVVITGTVRDQLGKPAENVEISLSQTSVFSPRSAKVRTDGEGNFEIRGWSEGDYALTASGGNFLNRVSRKFFLYAGDSRREEFSLNRGLVVSGRVFGADGQPAARVSVWLNQSSSTSATTNTEGFFSFPKAKPGRARIYTRMGGKSGQDFSERLEIDIVGDTSDLRVVMSASHVIEGILLDHEGQPRAKVTVTAQARDNSSLKRTGKTDADGRFQIRGCYSGPYVVSAKSARNLKRIRSKSKRRRLATTATNVDVSRSGAPFVQLRDR